MTGQQSKLSLEVILDAWYPNTMSMGEKLWHWAVQVKKFIVDEPREANSEGGVFRPFLARYS